MRRIAYTWGRVWDPSPTKNGTISARETNRTKKSISTTAQTYWQSSAEIWEGQGNYSLKNEVDKDAISFFSTRKDWRFALSDPKLVPSAQGYIHHSTLRKKICSFLQKSGAHFFLRSVFKKCRCRLFDRRSVLYFLVLQKEYKF